MELGRRAHDPKMRTGGLVMCKNLLVRPNTLDSDRAVPWMVYLGIGLCAASALSMIGLIAFLISLLF